ncbi:transporter substrate-binding domain-containing protein [Marinobacter sp. ATCH36]|uniref:transporter substrate-binding domain-containing protein n=1 Tax=Marinobacter sp. ATCH36 TaxID=2945106 RepID=UPI002020114E|nr:transporter substrate-binding domain-containing protein [Marinobacter sp. ATCH36]MCL7943459.1 transporter substrate-binding domain-containing protein [Marinobacter sp. ATCH36]
MILKELNSQFRPVVLAFAAIVVLFTLGGLPRQGAADQSDTRTRVITTPSTTSEVSVVFGKNIVRQLYNGCGLTIRYLDAPAARAVMMAEKSQSDGELARIPMAVKENAPLIPLHIPIEVARLVPLFLDRESASAHSGLTGKRIGFLNGYRMIAAVLPEDATQVATTDTFQLVSLLKRERIDVALTLEWDALAASRHNPDMVIGEPLLESPIYHWVHESREKDIPCLSETLDDMKTDGEVHRLIREGIESSSPK